MAPLRMVTIALVALAASAAFADDLLYRYEADVLPYDPSAGWINGSPCRDNDGCIESLQDGHLILHWADSGDIVGYGLWIARPEDPPPPSSLWVEWRYRSDQAFTGSSIYCDGRFNVHYGEIQEPVSMFGDAAFSFSGDDFVIGLDIDEFHNYRFESLDGIIYWFSVDGMVFTSGAGREGNGYHTLGFGGEAGCLPLPTTNEWDFVRYGTISFGEKIVASDPPGGFLDPRQYPSLDRFTVTFDSPNYVYLADITVERT
ncbi:MAG: hypothetical protein IIC01_08740, partial [Planctomycetes bacterium]|nr:hypothetical protein [Planctomycetota bacterium]